MTARINVDSVDVSRGNTKVLQGLSLSVARGEVVALLGPNGAGKSTLLETIGGGLQPDRGTVTLDGRVATVMQSPGLARRTALANVELALAWWGVPRRVRQERAMDALDQLGILHLALRPPAVMSGGERRRVHLARGLALEPEVLLLDEPFAGLDLMTRTSLCEDTATALRDGDRAVVLVVHDRTEAWALADRIVLLLDGQIVANGTPNDVLDAPPTVAAAEFLGYDGCLDYGNELLLTRPAHVTLTPDGEFVGEVTRIVPHEDLARIDVTTVHGTVRAYDPSGDVRLGDSVKLRVSGGVRFPKP